LIGAACFGDDELNSGWMAALARFSIGRMMFACLAMAVAGGIVYAVSDTRQPTTMSKAQAAQEAETGATPAVAQTGPVTGLPMPRFVSLKSALVNVRRGPSSDHRVAWVFKRKDLPVEIIAEFDHWRRIRDSDGAEGWVYHSLLSGRRTVIAAPWAKGDSIDLKSGKSSTSTVVARVGSGAVGNLKACDGKWCEAAFGDYEGYVPQEKLFGAYPGEVYDD
jgi:SH3-like domain-containing protein